MPTKTPPRLPRGSKRRVRPGIYADRYGLLAIVTVGAVQKTGRYPADADLDAIEAWRLETRGALLKSRGPVGPAGTLAGEAPGYLLTIPAGRDKDDTTRRDAALYLRHWTATPLGNLPLRAITAIAVRQQIAAWSSGGAAGSTIRKRVLALRALYRVIDPTAPDPTAGLTIRAARPDDRHIPIALVRQLLANLPDRGRPVKGETKRSGAGRSAVSLTKIRLRVLAWTGLPHMQLERLRPRDVDFIGRRICLRPRRKGAGVEGVWLSLSLPPALEALRDYAAAGLWEQSFSRSSMRQTWRRTIARTRRQVEAAAIAANDPARLEAFDAAIPPSCHPYDLRHSFLTYAHEVSGDLRAVAELAQHASLETTKRYTRGAVSARVAAVSAAMSANWEQERLDAQAVTPAPALRLVKP